jgi:hypothetical protein
MNWRQYESWVAQDLGLTLSRGSGRLWWDKADAKSPGLAVEVKFSHAPQPAGQRRMRLRREWLDKVISEAGGRLGIVIFGLTSPFSSYVLVDSSALEDLTGTALEELSPGKSFMFSEDWLGKSLWRPCPVGVVFEYFSLRPRLRWISR